MASSIATTPSTTRTTRKRDRNDEDDDGIIINLERSAVGTPNSSSSIKNRNDPKQRNIDTSSTYTSPVATTSFLGRALSAVTSTVFKRRKVSSPTVHEQQHTEVASNGIDSTEKPITEDRIVTVAAAAASLPSRSKSQKSPHEQPKLFLSPRSPTRKVLQLDLYSNNGKSNYVNTAATSRNVINNYSTLMPYHNGPAPPISTLPPFQSSLLKQQQQQASNTSQKQITNMMTTSSAISNSNNPSFPFSSTDQILFSLSASNRKDQTNSLDFAFGRLRPKSRLFLHSSKSRNQYTNGDNKNKLSATETSKRILTALEEQKSLSLIPAPPEVSSYAKPVVSIFGGRDSYNSRLPGTHPFAPSLPPPPPPKQRLAQISMTLKPSTQLGQPSSITEIIKTTEEKQQQQQQPAAILPPMKSSEAIVTIHDSFLQIQPSTSFKEKSSHRKLPSRSQVQQHLQNIRRSKGYLESYQKLVKNVDTFADSFTGMTQENAVDDEIVNEVITELVEGQLQDHGDGIHDAPDGVVNSIISCQRERSAKRKPLHPKTTTGNDWWSTTNTPRAPEKVTNSATQPQRVSPTTTTAATVPVVASTPFSGPLLDKQRNNQVSHKITASGSQIKKSRLGGAEDLPYEPLKQVDANTLNPFGNKLDKPGPRDTAKSEPISSQADQQSNHTGDAITSDINFWGRHLLKPGQWKCSVCTVKNDATSSICTSCEAPKQQEQPKQIDGNGTGTKNSSTTTTAISINGEKSKEKVGFTFGTSTPSTFTSNNATTSASSGFSFGASTSANSTTVPKPFQFGSSTNEPGAPAGFTFGASSGFTTGATKLSSDATPSIGFTFGASSGFTAEAAKPSSDATTSNVVADSGSTGFLFGSASTETKAAVNDAAPAVSKLVSSSSSNIFNSSAIGSATPKSVTVPVVTHPPATVNSGSGGTAVTGQIAALIGADVSGGAGTSFGSSVGIPPPLSFGTSGTSAAAPAYSGFSFGAVPSTSSDSSRFQFSADASKVPSFEASNTKPATFAFSSGNTSASSSAPSSSFSFGAVPPATTQDPPILSFGTSNIAAPAPTPAIAPAPAPTVAGFSFGSASAPSINAQTATLSTGFTFGGSTSGQVGGMTGTIASNPFASTGINSSFQKDTSAPSMIATAPSSTFTFGSTAGSTPGFAAPMQPSFGAMQAPTSGLQQVSSSGSMPPGGGFSLGTGGSTGAKRRIIKAKRPSTSR